MSRASQKTREYDRNRYKENPERKLKCAREYYRANKDRILARQRERRETHPESLLLTSAKKRAEGRSLPFDLRAEDIHIPEFCPVLGIRLVTGDGDASPSLDRVIPSKGYVRGNVRVISHRANRLKNDATLEESCDVAEYIASTQLNLADYAIRREPCRT